MPSAVERIRLHRERHLLAVAPIVPAHSGLTAGAVRPTSARRWAKQRSSSQVRAMPGSGASTNEALQSKLLVGGDGIFHRRRLLYIVRRPAHIRRVGPDRATIAGPPSPALQERNEF